MVHLKTPFQFRVDSKVTGPAGMRGSSRLATHGHITAKVVTNAMRATKKIAFTRTRQSDVRRCRSSFRISRRNSARTFEKSSEALTPPARLSLLL